MTIIKPGMTVETAKTKSGKQVEFRHAGWEDISEMTDFINEVSKEDTYITFSGEVNTLRDEAKYLSSVLVEVVTGDAVKIVAWVDGRMVGVCDVHRITASKERKKHVGLLGLMVRKEYRGDGIGELLIRATISEARKRIKDLRIIVLDMYGENAVARALYEKVGFKEAGVIPGGVAYRGKFIDDVTMYLELES